MSPSKYIYIYIVKWYSGFTNFGESFIKKKIILFLTRNSYHFVTIKELLILSKDIFVFLSVFSPNYMIYRGAKFDK